MAHSDLLSPDSLNAGRAPHGAAGAGRDRSDDVEGILESADLGDPGLSLLVITVDAGIAPVESLRECVTCVVPQSRLVPPVGPTHESGPGAFRLPMADRAFDIVLGLRLVRPGIDATLLLREALRVLRHDGSLVLVTDRRDFQSAPLPPAGPAHLAQRALAAAGITHARFSQHGASSVAVIQRS
jgi:SAM-dependent methyltransferase